MQILWVSLWTIGSLYLSVSGSIYLSAIDTFDNMLFTIQDVTPFPDVRATSVSQVQEEALFDP